jgi:hypothetical protein
VYTREARRVVTNPITGRPMRFATRLEALEFCVEFQPYVESFGFQPVIAPIVIAPEVP